MVGYLPEQNLFACSKIALVMAYLLNEVLVAITFGQVSCSLCSETMEREILAVHKGENCPQRIVTCEYCEFPLPAVDLFEHQVVIVTKRKSKV